MANKKGEKMGQNLEKCLNLNAQCRQCPISNNKCYASNKSALIFENTFRNFIKEENRNKYKIVLITESPLNFPGCPMHEEKSQCDDSHWADNVYDFIQKHLQRYGLDRYDAIIFPRYFYIPCDIFGFIFHTFLPIFGKEKDKKKWGETFTKKIYWAHVAKRSLKGLNKRKAIEQCIPLLKEELEAIKPNLIIVATHWIFGYKGIEIYQKDHFSQNNGLIKSKDAEGKLKELIINKWKDKNEIINGLENMIKSISQKELEIAVFPNPSPGDPYKVKFYKQKYVPKLIKKIHEVIEKNYDNLPDC